MAEISRYAPRQAAVEPRALVRFLLWWLLSGRRKENDHEADLDEGYLIPGPGPDPGLTAARGLATGVNICNTFAN